MAEVHGAIHEQPMTQLKNLQIPNNLLRYIHQDATRYLTYLILDETNIDSWQARATKHTFQNNNSTLYIATWLALINIRRMD
jgi:hypothetical protein